jgi:hypothetical protein
MTARQTSERAFRGVSALHFAASDAVTIAWCASMFEDWRDADAWRLDDVDGVDADADAWTDMVRCRSIVPRHIGRDDDGFSASPTSPPGAAA